jgi:hypothetical protein
MKVLRFPALALFVVMYNLFVWPSLAEDGVHARPQTPTEKALEGFVLNPALDLALRANLGRSGGAFSRSMSGELNLRGDKVCVDIAPLVKPDGPTVALNTLGIRPPGATSLLQLLYIYSALRSDPARIDPSVQNDPTYKQDLGHAMEAALKRRFGRDISVNMNGDSSCMKDAWLLPRLFVEKGAEAKPIQGELIDIATITVADLRAAHRVRENAIESAKAQAAQNKAHMDAAGDVLAQSPSRGPDALYGALAVGSGRVLPCGVTPDATNSPRFGLDTRAVMTSAAFRAYMPQTPEPQVLYASAEELFADIAARKGKCTVVLGNGPLLATLMKALTRDGVEVVLLPEVLSEDDLADLHVAVLGFVDTPELSAIDTWLLAWKIGGDEPVSSETMAALRKLGVTTKQAYDDAVARLARSGLAAASGSGGVVDFLEDEREAAAAKTTIAKLRAQREAATLAAKNAALAAERDAESRKAIDFPFKAVLSCTIQNNVVPLQACMSKNGVETEVELRNGSDYHLYKVYDVSSLGSWGNRGVEIDLRRHFVIRIQNSDDTLVLNLVITNRASGAVVFQKSAGTYGVIQASN